MAITLHNIGPIDASRHHLHQQLAGLPLRTRRFSDIKRIGTTRCILQNCLHHLACLSLCRLYSGRIHTA
jgi:hypothetical protein